MRDFTRLRAQLRAALLCTPLVLAGCGGKSADTTTTTGNDDSTEIGNETTDDTPVAREVPWPIGSGYCDGGEWCGPVSQVTEVSGTSVANGCPESFGRENAWYSLNVDTTKAAQASGDPQACCYWWSDNGGCGKGRPLVEGGAQQVAPVREGGAWSKGELPAAPAMPDALREAIAKGWLDDALVEHASVASFARAALELMALGAPPELLADCQRAGLDEVRHAEGCFALVERYGGRRVAPGPIPAVAARPASLERLAVHTFAEGCVAETIATLGASRALARCEDPEVARLLGRFVRDETRHASLAWRTVAWAVREGGDSVRDALRAAAAAVAPPRDLPVAPSDPALLANGRLDEATKRAAVLDAWREIIIPTLEEVLHA